MSQNAEKRAVGRPSIYSPELIEELCFRLMEGRSMKSICDDDDMPDQRTVFRWLLDPEKAEFRQMYERARETQADTVVDETLDIADDGRNDWMERRGKDGGAMLNVEHVQRSKLRVEQRLKMAVLLHPRKYGMNNKVELSGGLDVRSKSTDELVGALSSVLAGVARREESEE